MFKLKKSCIMLGLILGTVFLILNVFAIGEVTKGIVFFLLFLFSAAFNVSEKKTGGDKTLIIIYAIWFILSAFVVFFCCQLIMNSGIQSIDALKLLLNIFICLFLFVLFYTFTLMPRISVCVVAVIMILLSIANYFVYIFRGTELQPIDILAIRTAGNVAAEYKFVMSNTLLYGCTLISLYVFVSLGLPKLNVKNKWKTRLYLIGTGIGLSIIFCVLVEMSTIKPIFWSQSGSIENGYFLNFYLQLKNTFVSEPEGYSSNLVESIAYKYKNTKSLADSNDKNEKNPDVIVIMDESFADFSVLGSELNTNQPVTPFIDSLSANTIRGYALSSIYGGGTPNSEYEVLVGNSLFFYQPGTIMYSQYLKDPTYSMVSEMKSNGYKCISLHPYMSSGWERTKVYPNLGVDESYFLEDFPQKDIIREFVSDQECFEKITGLYEENKKQDQNVFMFGVTMQNHGGYEYAGENYEQTIQLNGYKKDYEEAEQYLSLIHETDQAVKYLIEYFEKVNNEVVLVFYGDHFPNLNREFYEELYGGEFNSLDEQQLLYKVPFFIWTNYDIEEKNIELTSLNYLSNYIYDVSGLPMPEYNKVLLDIQKKIPALNANGYYSMEQKRFLTYAEATGEEAEVLDMYNQLQYNSLFDKKNRNRILFPEIEE